MNQLKDQVEPLKSQFQTCQSERQKEADVAKKQIDDLTAEKKRIQADLVSEYLSARGTVNHEGWCIKLIFI